MAIASRTGTRRGKILSKRRCPEQREIERVTSSVTGASSVWDAEQFVVNG